jgi:ABC-type transport system substrate-binding protein
VTAEDVAYTMNLYKTNHAYIPQGFLELIDGEVRVVDDTHIQFDTLGPTSLYTGERALHVLLHPAQACLRGDRAGQLPG